MHQVRGRWQRGQPREEDEEDGARNQEPKSAIRQVGEKLVSHNPAGKNKTPADVEDGSMVDPPEIEVAVCEEHEQGIDQAD